MHIYHDERRNPIDEEPYWFWVTGSKLKVNFATLCIIPCGHNIDYSFCPITFKLHMHIHHVERRNPIDFGSRGQLLWGDIVTRRSWVVGWVSGFVSAWVRPTLPCGHDSDYSFCPITFKLHMHSYHDERRNPIDEEPYWFWVTGSKVKVGTLCIRPCGHNSDYSFCPITFKLHMHIHHVERRNPIDFGSRGQRSRSTLALCV